MTTEKENVRRQQACLKACEAIPTDELEGMANDPIKGVFGRLAAKAIGERDQLRDALEALLADCDTGERDREGKQRGVAMPTKETVWVARDVLLKIKGSTR